MARCRNWAFFGLIFFGLLLAHPVEKIAAVQPFDCRQITTLSEQECVALVSLYHATDGDQWNNNEGWLQDSDPCAWHGVNCQMLMQEVTHLFLANNNLRGTLPSAIGDLDLSWLVLGSNHLTGALPEEIGKLTNLMVLDIGDNLLSGELPASMTQLTHLDGFHFQATTICVPKNSVMETWLLSIANLDVSGLRCAEGLPPVRDELAFVRRGDLYLIRADRSGVRQITSSGRDCCPAWSSDGLQLYFIRFSADDQLREAGKIYVYDFLRDAEQLIGPPEHEVRSRVAPVQDGSSLLFTYSEPIPPDGQLRLIDRRSCIARLSLSNAAVTTILCEEQVYFGGLALSPDETRIFVSWSSFEVYGTDSFALPGGRSIGRIFGMQPSVFPDNRTVTVVENDFFGTPEGQPITFWLYRVDTLNGRRTILLETNDRLSEPAVSHDGQYLLFVRDPRGIELLDLSNNHSYPVVGGEQPAWRPAVKALRPALVEEKAGLIDQLDKVYDESGAIALLGNFASIGADNVPTAQVMAFERLVLQERALAATLLDYEAIRDDHVNTSSHLAGLGIGTLFLASKSKGIIPTEFLQEVIRRTIEISVDAYLLTVPDEDLRATLREIVANLLLVYDVSEMDIEALTELITDPPLKSWASERLTDQLIDKVEPSLNRGVASVVEYTTPIWSVREPYRLAEMQIQGIMSESQFQRDVAHGNYGDIVEGREVNDLLLEIGDLGTLAHIPYAQVVSLWTRVQGAILDLATQRMLGNSLSCIRDLSAMAGEVAFQPPSKFLSGCLDLNTGDGGSWLEPVRPSLEQSLDDYLLAATTTMVESRYEEAAALRTTIGQLMTAHIELSQQVSTALQLLASPEGASLSPEAGRLVRQLLQFQFESAGFTITLAAAMEIPEDQAITMQLAQTLASLEATAQDIHQTLAVETVSSSQPLPAIIVVNPPSSLSVTMARPFVVPLTVHNYGSVPSTEAQALIQSGKGVTRTLLIPAILPGNTLSLTTTLTIADAGQYTFWLSADNLLRSFVITVVDLPPTLIPPSIAASIDPEVDLPEVGSSAEDVPSSIDNRLLLVTSVGLLSAALMAITILLARKQRAEPIKPAHCSQCGCLLPVQAVFCGYCGARVTALVSDTLSGAKRLHVTLLGATSMGTLGLALWLALVPSLPSQVQPATSSYVHPFDSPPTTTTVRPTATVAMLASTSQRVTSALATSPKLTPIPATSTVVAVTPGSSRTPPADTTTPLPSSTPERGPEPIFLGTSALGSEIEALRVGNGANVVVLVGGLHAGFAPSTVALAQDLALYFATNTLVVPNDVTVYIVVSASPDSDYAPGTLEGRLNANGVDLNRNWDCRWVRNATWRGEVMPGIGGRAPFSEPETSALASFISRVEPAAVVFWEAKATGGLVAPGMCTTISPSAEELAHVYGQASSYAVSNYEELTNQELNGDATNWLVDQGFPAIAVLLPDYIYVDWKQDLAGVLAVLRHVSQR